MTDRAAVDDLAEEEQRLVRREPGRDVRGVPLPEVRCCFPRGSGRFDGNAARSAEPGGNTQVPCTSHVASTSSDLNLCTVFTVMTLPPAPRASQRDAPPRPAARSPDRGRPRPGTSDDPKPARPPRS